MEAAALALPASREDDQRWLCRVLTIRACDPFHLLTPPPVATGLRWWNHGDENVENAVILPKSRYLPTHPNKAIFIPQN